MQTSMQEAPTTPEPAPEVMPNPITDPVAYITSLTKMAAQKKQQQPAPADTTSLPGAVKKEAPVVEVKEEAAAVTATAVELETKTVNEPIVTVKKEVEEEGEGAVTGGGQELSVAVATVTSEVTVGGEGLDSGVEGTVGGEHATKQSVPTGDSAASTCPSAVPQCDDKAHNSAPVPSQKTETSAIVPPVGGKRRASEDDKQVPSVHPSMPVIINKAADWITKEWSSSATKKSPPAAAKPHPISEVTNHQTPPEPIVIQPTDLPASQEEMKVGGERVGTPVMDEPMDASKTADAAESEKDEEKEQEDLEEPGTPLQDEPVF